MVLSQSDGNWPWERTPLFKILAWVCTNALKHVHSQCPVWTVLGSMWLSTFTVLQNCSLVYVWALCLAYPSRSPGVRYQQQGEKVSSLISELWCIIETSESATLLSLSGWYLNASLLVEVLSSGSELLCLLAVARSSM